jgi:hypothetical protein
VFEKIGNAAERLATNVSESRRGFLARLGQAALGVAGVVGGLLALPTEAHAFSGITHACQQTDFNILTGLCIDNRKGDCTTCSNSASCPVGTAVGRSFAFLSGIVFLLTARALARDVRSRKSESGEFLLQSIPNKEVSHV